MEGKYIIILLFIFLVFLMGSINSTITNNFYNTTDSQDHFNLTNLSYAESGHTGFQSSDSLNDDISSLGYVTNETGNFLNSSTGGTVIGNIIINDGIKTVKMGDMYSAAGFEFTGPVYNSSFVTLNNSLCQFSVQALNAYYQNSNQTWWKYNTSQDSIIILSSVCKDGTANKPNVATYMSAPTSNPFINFDLIFFYDTSQLSVFKNTTITTLAGSGNAYSCVDSTGKLYRGSPTC